MDSKDSSNRRSQNTAPKSPATPNRPSQGAAQSQPQAPQPPSGQTPVASPRLDQNDQDSAKRLQWAARMARRRYADGGRPATAGLNDASRGDSQAAQGASSPNRPSQPQPVPRDLDAPFAETPAGPPPNARMREMPPPTSFALQPYQDSDPLPSFNEAFPYMRSQNPSSSTPAMNPFGMTGFAQLDDPFVSAPTPTYGQNVALGGSGYFHPPVAQQSPYLLPNPSYSTPGQAGQLQGYQQMGGGRGQTPLDFPTSSQRRVEHHASPMVAPHPHRNVSRQSLAVSETLALQQMQGTSSQLAPFPPAFQLPPLDLARRRFQTDQDALKYLNRPQWRPISKNHGVPTRPEDRLPYVKRLYDAMVDSDQIWDSEWADDADRFRVDGFWGRHPEAIEAICHEIVDLCIKIHVYGVTGQALLCIPHLRKMMYQNDRSFTFAERIYWMAHLLRHYKFNANLVMHEDCILQYLAKIWSTLLDKPQFHAWWTKLSKEEMDQHYHVKPFEGVPAQPMTKEEKAQYEALANQELQKVLLAQQRQQPQSTQSQLPQTQNAPKRPYEAVEEPEAGPSPKRRTVGEPSVETAPLEQTQEQDAEPEITMEQLRDLQNQINDLEEQTFADRHPPSTGDEEGEVDWDVELFGEQNPTPFDLDSDQPADLQHLFGNDPEHVGEDASGDAESDGEGGNAESEEEGVDEEE